MVVGNPIGSLWMRSMQWGDLEFARQQRNNPETRKWLAQQGTVSFWQQIKWFWKLRSDKSRDRLIVHYNQVPIGVVRLDDIDLKNKSICIGMDLDPAYRGKGLAQTSYILLIDHFFSQHFNRIWLLVGSYNDRAAHVYTKVGMTLEGTQRQALLRDGKYYDYHMMSILKDEYYDDTKCSK